MGYDLHITRADDWFDSESTPISLEEWIEVVERDPEMRVDDFAEADVEGHILRYENDGLSVWTAYSGHGVDGNMAWFDFRNGRVVVKNPDDEIIGKMRALAATLGARVVGDEGESY